MLLLETIVLGFFSCHRRVQFFPIGMIIRQCGVHLGQREVRDLRNDFCGSFSHLVPADNASDRYASAGNCAAARRRCLASA